VINLESARSLTYPCRRLASGYRASRGVTVLGRFSPGQLCPATSPAREDAQALVDCLRTMISEYWTSAVGEPVQTTIVAGPEPMLDRNVAEFEEAYPYAVASTVAHGFGHVGQHVVHQPGIDQPPTPEESQALKQRADCSAGVWAADAVGAERLNAVTFRAAYEQALVAYDAGFAAGTGTACGLIGID